MNYLVNINEYIPMSKLIALMSDGSTEDWRLKRVPENVQTTRKFQIRDGIGIMCYDAPKDFTLCNPYACLTIIILTYLEDCTSELKRQLHDRSRYLRIGYCQDEPNELPDSHPYVYVYTRPIKDMLPDHLRIVEPFLCSNKYIGEVMYAKRANFFTIDTYDDFTPDYLEIID